MASSVQIVPKWSFPHVSTYIYDNTEVTDTPSSTVDDSYKTIHVFRSGKGIDNKLVKKIDTDDFADTFGKTDYKKYGQPLMMPYASLSSGRTSTYCMRIMPGDATFANSALYVYYRTATAVVTENVYDENGDITYAEDGITPATKEVTKPMFQVMFRAVSVSPEVDAATNRLTGNDAGITSKKELESRILKGVADITATDGGNDWTCLPLMYFYSVGRGTYGDKYTWRISKNAEYEKDYGSKIYSFEITNNESGAVKIATYVGSLVTDVVDNKSTMINDVITDYNAGEYPVEIFSYEESVDILYDEYVKFLTELAESDETAEIVVPAETEFDVFFGKTINSNDNYEYYQVVDVDNSVYPVVDDANAVDLSDIGGVAFAGGYDGAFSTFISEDGKTAINGATELLSKEMYNEAVRSGITHLEMGVATVEDYVYAQAFSGMLDKAILSTLRTPADYLLDANYSYFTKLSYAELALTRNDCLIYIDLGTDYESFSTSVLRSITDKYSGIFRDRLVSLNTHAWKVNDPFTSRKVLVTPTYWIASALPVHWVNFGMQQPFAKSYAQITGHIKNSIQPVVDIYEAELMESLANMRVNYVEAIGENVFQRGIQNTGQIINSDLLEESNVHVLMWLKRHIEMDCFANLYNFADASDRAAFKQIEEAKYEFMIGSMVSSLEIRFDMSEWEHQRQILHCYLEIEFRTINKRAIVEIDVNKRRYNA